MKPPPYYEIHVLHNPKLQMWGGGWHCRVAYWSDGFDRVVGDTAPAHRRSTALNRASKLIERHQAQLVADKHAEIIRVPG